MHSGQHIYTGTSSEPVRNLIQTVSGVTTVKYEGLRTYLDTFDWRLLKAGVAAYVQKNELVLASDGNEHPEAIRVKSRPKFAADLPPGAVRTSLMAVTGIRALMPVLRQRIYSEEFGLPDRNKKTVLRIAMEHVVPKHDEPVFLTLYPVKGYEDVFAGFTGNLRDIGFLPDSSTFFEYLVRKDQISTERFGSRKSYRIFPDMSVAQAVREIHAHLMNIMQENEQGIIQDIDTEFLHDFRVAVRRTRSLYGEVKDHINPALFAQAKTDFSALGKRTNRLRDIDVYLLNRSEYENLLPGKLRPALNSFFSHLEKERKIEHKRFAGYLQSTGYSRLIEKWRKILNEGPDKIQTESGPVLQFAVARILERYHQVIATGDRITENTPDKKLHKLRIEGKKLRYTVEFFSGLFDPGQVADMIRHLKKLQDNLGLFNDLSVQQAYLNDFACSLDQSDQNLHRLMITFGVLIGRLYGRQKMVREKFGENYTYFSETRNSGLITELSTIK